MLRKGLGLLVVLGLASLGLAQTTDDHTVTVNIPSILTLSLDATDYLFDFADTTATGTVTVGAGSYPRAGMTNYDAFLDTATSPQDFAPTSVAGTGGNDYGTLVVRTNRASWEVTLSISPGSFLPAPLDNGRVKVYAEKVSGKGGSWTPSPTPVTSVTTLISSYGGGQGRSEYRIYYLLTLDPADDIPTSGYYGQITVNYTLTPLP